jgi:hypothetical protein
MTAYLHPPFDCAKPQIDKLIKKRNLNGKSSGKEYGNGGRLSGWELRKSRRGL